MTTLNIRNNFSFLFKVFFINNSNNINYRGMINYFFCSRKAAISSKSAEPMPWGLWRLLRSLGWQVLGLSKMVRWENAIYIVTTWEPITQRRPEDHGPGCGVMLESSVPFSVPFWRFCTILYHVFGAKSLILCAESGTRTRTSIAHCPLKTACLPVPPSRHIKVILSMTKNTIFTRF